MKPGLKRRTDSPASLNKYRPIIDLLENRLVPGNMLSLGGDALTGAALGAQGTLGKTSALTNEASSSAALFEAALLSNTETETLPAIVPTSPSGSSSTPTISNVFASNDTNPFVELTFAESAKAGLGSVLGSAGGSAFGSGTSPTGGSVNSSTASTPEMFLMNSPLIVNSGPTGGEGGGSGAVARTAGVTATPNGYGTNIDQLGGPIQQAQPTAGIFLSNGNMDVRTPYLTGQRVGLSQQQLVALQNLQASLTGLRVNVNTIFGTPSSIINTGGYLTSASSLNPRDVVQQFIYANKDALGLTDDDVQELVTTDMYTDTVGKPITHVYLEQAHNGIPVAQSLTNGSVTKDGQLLILGNHLVPDLAGSINTSTPVLNQAQAIWYAAQNLGLNVTQPVNLIENTGGPSQAQTYVSAELSRDPIPVSLAYLPIQQGETRLVWHTVLNSPATDTDWFEINVDAQTGQVWNRQGYIQYDSYRVFKANLTDPEDGSATVQTNPADPLANGFPNLTVVTWHNIDGDPEPETFTTTGNNVIAQEDRDGDDSPIGRRPSGGANNVYDIKFDPLQEPYVPAGPFQPAYTNNMFAAIVQGYYWTNIFHDITYRAGFTEAAGNFQIFNFGRGGRGNDPVLLDVQDDHDNGTVNNAFFATPPDSFAGRAAMFVWDFTAPDRDSSMDSTVLYHELGHGWSNRMVGGPSYVVGLGGTQSGGAGEGWSDWVATWLTTKASENAGDPRGGAGYLVEVPGNLGTDRRALYDTTQGTFGKPNTYDNPLTYNDIDPVQFDVVFPLNPPIFPSLISPDEVHNVGEVWAETLWDLNWRLIKKYGFSTDLYNGQGGNNIAMKLVSEGLKLTTIDPTFLNSRDAILAADMALYGGANQLQIWQAFAGRGMGQFSNDGGDHNSTAVREDYTVPPIPPFGGGGGGGSTGNYPGNGKKDNNYEPNEFSNNAYNLGGMKGVKLFPGLKIKGSTPQDRDWFRFKTKSSGDTSIQVDMASNAGDLDLIVYRKTSSGTLNEIGRSTSRQNGGSESVDFDAQGGVQYFFQVIGFNGAKGNYGFTISAPG